MKNGITLQFLESEIVPYVQRTGRFDAALSIIDMMMFCDKEEIQDMLELYTIFKIISGKEPSMASNTRD